MTQPDNRENLSQRETVVLLQQTIDQLRAIISQLNTGAVANLPDRAAVDRLCFSTQQLAGSLIPSAEEEEGLAAIEDILTPAFPSEKLGEREDFIPSSRQKQVWWAGIFPKIRAIPPRLRTGLLTGSVVAMVLAAVFLLPQNLPDIARNLPAIAPKVPPEVIETPPELKAPDLPIPVPISKPEPKLTPEQSLVAAIQEEITDLTSRYPEGLISTVEADFLGSRLTVIVGESWYGLNTSRQDKFADSISQRSQRLDFRRLEIKDTSGILLARSPVVGDRVVIITRIQPSS
jgi:hypothetical protein